IRQDGKRLTVAMANPKDVFAIDEMRMKTGLDVRAVLCPPSQVEALKNGSLNGTNGTGATILESEDGALGEQIGEMLDMLAPVQNMTGRTKKDKRTDSQKAQEGSATGADEGDTELSGDIAGSAAAADEAPIIRIVNTVIMYAIKDGASDIHIEPQQKQVRIRYRIDGVLHEQMKVPQHILAPMISRVKIMSAMNIAER